ncbi:PRD domain-containing protein [[Clostridium] innocuum]|nr:PRD domain-containing protein [[Clostridium] innocuum]MCR0445367.1 PRD domain-containing protein [[Clostridium] innocuum]
MDKKKKLLALLSSANHPVTGKELSSRLNVSDRTIRNYIREINEEKLIIQSSSNGYRLSTLDSTCNQKPDNSFVYDFSSQNERLLYISERIITSSQDADLYDIADEIYISYSTMEKDLIQIRSLIKDFHLSLQRANGKVIIQGSEESKRSFIRYLLSEQDSATVHNTLLAICKDIHISFDTLKDLILYHTRQQKLYASDYAIKNILTHVIITLSRLQNKYSLQQQNTPSAQEKEPESICAANIIQEIEANYNIMFNTEEKNQLIFLLMSKTARLDRSIQTKKQTQNFISQEYIAFTKQLIENINYIYYIDLNDSDFINFFSLHLKNVLFRWNNNTFNVNPFSDQIFIQNPLIYDIAVYIANEIHNRYHCRLNKDEITFISLHIGAVIEKRQKKAIHIEHCSL